MKPCSTVKLDLKISTVTTHLATQLYCIASIAEGCSSEA
jgi:hypothetical protein